MRSPNFGGGSELAHLGLLSGLDLSDRFRDDLLLTGKRPTLASFFRDRGYQSFGLYQSLSWDWPEKAFYAYGIFADARVLNYLGPQFGSWWVPDYVKQLRQRDCVLSLIGDHQPASSVSGRDAPWEVPVHVITSNPDLIKRLQVAGLQPGLEPKRPIFGQMHEFTQALLDMFDSRASSGSR